MERMVTMLELLKKQSELSQTANGGICYSSSGSFCLDLFFGAGAMRCADEGEISSLVIRAFAEDPEKTVKIIFYARDVRGGLGERRFFRVAVKTLAYIAPEAVSRNVRLFSEYGRYDDLCELLGTPCEADAVAVIKRQLYSDTAAMSAGKPISLLAKWLPSVNASSLMTREKGRMLASKLNMKERSYRKTLSALRRYSDVLENRLREKDYTFSYEKLPSCASFKYRNAFFRNDKERYTEYLTSVEKSEKKMNASLIYPYEIVRKCEERTLTAEQRNTLDLMWRNLPDYGGDEKAIAVVDGSGSMYCDVSVRPVDAAVSLGIYFAEHNKGAFGNHFITFSEHPQLVEIKGSDIFEKVQYCETFNEVANTNLEAVFLLILKTAKKNGLPQSELPERLYIISDMEFDSCVFGGNSRPLFRLMKELYEANGYILPEVVFWNVCGYGSVPVRMSETGSALVSGFTPALFRMVTCGEISPEKVMNSIISSERYKAVS